MVWSAGIDSCFALGESEEAVGDEANLKLKLHQLYTMFGNLVGPCSSFDR